MIKHKEKDFIIIFTWGNEMSSYQTRELTSEERKQLKSSTTWIARTVGLAFAGCMWGVSVITFFMSIYSFTISDMKGFYNSIEVAGVFVILGFIVGGGFI